jgi:hypothetical protein
MRGSMSSGASMASRNSLVGNNGVLRNDSILYFTVLGARGLKNTQSIGVQDPFCTVTLVSNGKEATTGAFKTSTHDNGGTADPTVEWFRLHRN